MGLRRYSRFMFCTVLKDDDGVSFLTEPEPYYYRDLSDNRLHSVQDGETLDSIASLYYPDFPTRLDWLFGWFQPQPILDPTLALDAGSKLVVPSLQTVLDAFNEDRRDAVDWLF